MSQPFTPFRACRFAFFWILAISVVFAIFYVLMQVRSGSGVTSPQGSSIPHKADQ